MKNISEDQVRREIDDELKKNLKTFAHDIVREANTLPTAPAGAEQNLDIIKHLIKRLAIHQVVIERQSKWTNIWLLILSIVMAIGALFTVLQYFKN